MEEKLYELATTQGIWALNIVEDIKNDTSEIKKSLKK